MEKRKTLHVNKVIITLFWGIKILKRLINNYIKMQPEIKKLIIHMVSLSKERKPNMLPLTITFSDILIPRSSSKWGKYSLKMVTTIQPPYIHKHQPLFSKASTNISHFLGCSLTSRWLSRHSIEAMSPCCLLIWRTSWRPTIE